MYAYYPYGLDLYLLDFDVSADMLATYKSDSSSYNITDLNYGQISRESLKSRHPVSG